MGIFAAKAVLDDILVLESASVGRLQFSPEPVDLVRCLARTQSLFSPHARQRHIALLLRLPELGTSGVEPRTGSVPDTVLRHASLPVQLWVVADRHKLEQVLRNFVSNAVKFSPPHTTVTLALGPAQSPQALDATKALALPSDHREDVDESKRKEEEEEEQRVVETSDRITWVRLSVLDEGKGVSDDDRPKLFRAFGQLAPSGSSASGTGLGLSISRTVVEGLGGRVDCLRRPSGGSEFFAELPVRLTRPHLVPPASFPTPTMSEESPLPLSSDAVPQLASEIRHRTRRSRAPKSEGGTAGARDVQTVCVVDDDDVLRRLLVRQLSERGWTALPARSSDELFRVCRDSAATLVGVVLDCHLGAENGRDVALALRRHQDPRVAGIPVIGLTGAALDADIRLFHAAGVDEVLLKPSSANDIDRAIRRVALSKA
jgi:CheY-like chemotaxis protein